MPTANTWFQVLAVLALFIPGCSDCANIYCAACEYPLTITVAAAGTESLTCSDILAQEEVQGVTLNVGCYLDGNACICRSSRNEIGARAVTVSAPGYEPFSARVEITEHEPQGCCDCGYDPQKVNVALKQRSS